MVAVTARFPILYIFVYIFVVMEIGSRRIFIAT